MDPIPTALVVGAITTLGRWANGKGLTIQTVVGVVGIAVSLSLIEQFSSEIARGFGVLILLGTSIIFLPAVFKKSGVTK
jgi:hypothetical protein